MKKRITFYLIGVVLCWPVTYVTVNDMNQRHNQKTTYGDLVIVTVMSIGSWPGLLAAGCYHLSKSDFLDKPI